MIQTKVFKLIIVLAVVVVLVGICLRLSERGSEDSSAPVQHNQAATGNASQKRSPMPNHLRRSAGSTPLPETQEDGAVDFDWRQVLRDKVGHRNSPVRRLRNTWSGTNETL